MNTPVWVMVTVALYVLVTAPFLPLLILSHRQGGDNATYILAGLALQLIPLGLIFFPLGLVGVAYLMALLWTAHRRNLRFDRSGLHHPELQRQWQHEVVLLWWATGFGIQQKIIALLFLDASARHVPGMQWVFAGGVSLLLWAVITQQLRRFRRSTPPVATRP